MQSDIGIYLVGFGREEEREGNKERERAEGRKGATVAATSSRPRGKERLR